MGVPKRLRCNGRIPILEGENMTNRLDVLDREVAFLREVADVMEARGWRLGQAIWNLGAEQIPDSEDGSGIDPFHNDDRIGQFMEALREAWAAA